MIQETKYYLGTVETFVNSVTGGDNTKRAFAHERDIENCKNNTVSSATESGCRVWSGNQTTWTGNIALMYPSDYGYSASSSNWDNNLYNQNPTSWLQSSANHDKNNLEWLLSPSTDYSSSVTCWQGYGYISGFGVSNYERVRPCLYLKSDVKILEDTTGEESNPYQLTM